MHTIAAATKHPQKLADTQRQWPLVVVEEISWGGRRSENEIPSHSEGFAEPKQKSTFTTAAVFRSFTLLLALSLTISAVRFYLTFPHSLSLYAYNSRIRSFFFFSFLLWSRPSFGIAFDIDGVLLRGESPIGGSPQALKRLYDPSGMLSYAY